MRFRGDWDGFGWRAKTRQPLVTKRPSMCEDHDDGGVGARDVGRWLKGVQLRQENGWPSREAIDRGFVRDRALEHGGVFWLWEKGKTCYQLDMMGYRRGGQGPKVEEYDGFVLIRGGE